MVKMMFYISSLVSLTDSHGAWWLHKRSTQINRRSLLSDATWIFMTKKNVNYFAADARKMLNSRRLLKLVNFA